MNGRITVRIMTVVILYHPTMLLNLSSRHIPCPAKTIFGRRGPLVIEIGHGNGSFLRHLAIRHPDWNLLGAESSLGSVSRTFRRLKHAGTTNVRLYHGSGLFILRNVVPVNSVHRVYINFPDPWPKKRHQDRRLLQSSFFKLAAGRLAPSGSIWLTTDHAEYFDFSVANGKAAPHFSVDTTADPPAAARKTKYARRWIDEGKIIYHARFCKESEPAHPIKPTITTQPGTMHHAILQGTIPDVDAFEKQVHAFDSGHVILLDAARPLGDDRLILFVRVDEPELTQELLVEVRPHEQGVFVGVMPFARPLSTPGTRAAIRITSRWLEGCGLRLQQQSF